MNEEIILFLHIFKDTVRLSVVSNNPDYLQNYEKKIKNKKNLINICFMENNLK